MFDTIDPHPKFEKLLKLGVLKFFYDTKEMSYFCLYLPHIGAKWNETYAYCIKGSETIGGNGLDESGRKIISHLLWDCFDKNLVAKKFEELTPTVKDIFVEIMEEVL